MQRTVYFRTKSLHSWIDELVERGELSSTCDAAMVQYRENQQHPSTHDMFAEIMELLKSGQFQPKTQAAKEVIADVESYQDELEAAGF